MLRLTRSGMSSTVPSGGRLQRIARTRWGLLALALAAAVLVAAVLNVREARARAMLMRADPDTVLADSAQREPALAAGRHGFARYCASCHGTDGAPDRVRGMPDLRDGDYLYGEGRVSEIEQIVLHGIRAHDTRGSNLASMPAYAKPRPYGREPIKPLTPADIEDVTQFLLSYTDRATDPVAASRGGAIYADRGGCWDCHGRDASGDTAIGAPDLTDRFWLYGDGGHDVIAQTLAKGRAGVSPAFARRVDPATARAIAVYVASLSEHARPRTGMP